jgi:hypothetical protein
MPRSRWHRVTIPILIGAEPGDRIYEFIHLICTPPGSAGPDQPGSSWPVAAAGGIVGSGTEASLDAVITRLSADGSGSAAAGIRGLVPDRAHHRRSAFSAWRPGQAHENLRGCRAAAVLTLFTVIFVLTQSGSAPGTHAAGLSRPIAQGGQLLTSPTAPGPAPGSTNPAITHPTFIDSITGNVIAMIKRQRKHAWLPVKGKPDSRNQRGFDRR